MIDELLQNALRREKVRVRPHEFLLNRGVDHEDAAEGNDPLRAGVERGIRRQKKADRFRISPRIRKDARRMRGCLADREKRTNSETGGQPGERGTAAGEKK